MATVHCPGCGRALNLPDDREIERVVCPLCGRDFVPPPTPKIEVGEVTPPTQLFSPAPLPPGDERLPLRTVAAPGPDEDREPVRHRGEGRMALDSASAWLSAMGWLGLGTTLPCCGLYGLTLSNFSVAGGGGEWMLLVLCPFIVAFGVILSAAGSMKRLGSFGYSFAGVVVAMLTTLGIILLNVPSALAVLDRWPSSPVGRIDLCCGSFLILPSAALILCGLVGGTKGLFILLRPGTRELFQASRGNPFEKTTND